MRILQLHNHHSSLGGAMEVLAHEGQLLRDAGHDVTEYTLPAAETLGLPAWRAGAKAVWNLEAQREVSRRIAGFRPDVVHVHTPFPLMSPSVFQAAYRAGVPAVTTLHSYRYSCVVGTCVRDDRICEDCVGSRLKLAGVRHRCYHESAGATAALTLGLAVHRAAGTFHHAVTRYLTLTDFSRRLLIRDGFPADKIVVKPNSVPDPGPGPRSPQERTVLFVGRLIDRFAIKRLYLAIVLPGRSRSSISTSLAVASVTLTPAATGRVTAEVIALRARSRLRRLFRAVGLCSGLPGASAGCTRSAGTCG